MWTWFSWFSPQDPDKKLTVKELYEVIEESSPEDLTFRTFLEEFEEFYETLRKADVLLLKDKKSTIKYPWENLLK
jgi:hypothetical protein